MPDTMKDAISLQITDKWSKPIEQLGCPHQDILLDEESRLIKCKKCGLVMDGFSWVLHRARDQRVTQYEIKWLTEDRNNLRKEIEDLKREKNNLKAQIKRIKK